MKRILAIIGIVLLLSSSAWGQDRLFRGGGCPVASGGGDVGYTTAGGESNSFFNGYVFCQLDTAVGSGTSQTGYIYADQTSGAYATVCGYSSAGSTTDPNNSGNVKKACTSAGGITISTTGWNSDAVDTPSDSFSDGVQYWICGCATGNSFAAYNTKPYGAGSWWISYDCPTNGMPANLGIGTWNEYGDDRQWSMYIHLQ